MRRLAFVLMLCLLFASVAHAQETTPAPTPIDQAQLDLFRQYSDEARRSMEEAARYAEDASRFLGIFEAISVAIAIAGAALGVVGVTRLFSAQRDLAAARKRVDEEMTAQRKKFDTELAELRAQFESEVGQKEKSLAQMSEILLENLEHQRRTNEKSTLALSLLPLGERQYKAQDLQGAADTYKRALALDENNPLIHYRLGYVYVQSSQLQDAERHLLRALEIDPEFHLAKAALGYVYRRIGDKMPIGLERDQMLNKAEAYLINALQASPKLVDDDSESWWGSLGGLYRRRGQMDQAVYAYEQAAKVTPHSSYPFSNLAMLYMSRNNRDQMLTSFKRVERLARGEVQAEVDNYWAYADLLTSRLALGKVEEAEEALVSVFDLSLSNSSYGLESLVDTLTRLLNALGGDENAPHIQPFIDRIKQRIDETHEAKIASA
ncbi:MAG: tetratricopeptide repeat protein [Anaerolinea sp.]|nr:tetratricopeptide repeat protein [Anaerolinea sp.]